MYFQRLQIRSLEAEEFYSNISEVLLIETLSMGAYNCKTVALSSHALFGCTSPKSPNKRKLFV